MLALSRQPETKPPCCDRVPATEALVAVRTALYSPCGRSDERDDKDGTAGGRENLSHENSLSSPERLMVTGGDDYRFAVGELPLGLQYAASRARTTGRNVVLARLAV